MTPPHPYPDILRQVVEAAIAADSRRRREPNPVPPDQRWIEITPASRKEAP